MEPQSEESAAAPDPPVQNAEEDDSWEHSAIPQLQALSIKDVPPLPVSDDGEREQSVEK